MLQKCVTIEFMQSYNKLSLDWLKLTEKCLWILETLQRTEATNFICLSVESNQQNK